MPTNSSTQASSGSVHRRHRLQRPQVPHRGGHAGRIATGVECDGIEMAISGSLSDTNMCHQVRGPDTGESRYLPRVSRNATQGPVIKIDIRRHPTAGTIQQALEIAGHQGGHELIDGLALFALGYGSGAVKPHRHECLRRCLKQNPDAGGSALAVRDTDQSLR